MPKKKKVTCGYICGTCGKTRTGAHTDRLKESTAPCPGCFAEGKSQKYMFIAHVDSSGEVECISGECPRHGEIKRLYNGYQQPTFQRNYSRWLTGTAQEPPRVLKEI